MKHVTFTTIQGEKYTLSSLLIIMKEDSAGKVTICSPEGTDLQLSPTEAERLRTELTA